MPSAKFIVIDQANLRQRPRQHRRSLHQRIQRDGAGGQHGRRVEGRQFPPMPSGGGVEGGGEFLPQDGAKRGFQTSRHGQGVVHRRPTLAVLDREDFRQRLAFGSQTGTGGIGRRLRLPHAAQAGGRRGPRLFGGLQGHPFGRQVALGLDRVVGCLRQQSRIDLLGGDAGAFVVQPGELVLQAAEPLVSLGQQGVDGIGAGIGLGRGLGSAVGGGLGRAQGFGGLRRGGFQSGGAGGVVGIRLGQCRLFGAKAFLGRGGVALQLLGVEQVALDGIEPPGRFPQGGAGALLLLGDPFLCQAMAFQRGARHGFHFA